MGFILAALLALAPGDGPKISEIDSLKTLIKPRAEETRWEEIPWMVDLWEARKKAAQTGKPLMLWEMDGNPMGCG
jgi:hypothetical protein